MVYVFEILLIAANISMAWWHSVLIEQKQKTPQHGWWGLAYLSLAVLLSWLCSSWVLFVASLFIRKVFFDLSLNLFRSKPLFYTSATTTSIIDKVHYKLFGNRSEVYMSVYFLFIIFLTILL